MNKKIELTGVAKRLAELRQAKRLSIKRSASVWDPPPGDPNNHQNPPHKGFDTFIRVEQRPVGNPTSCPGPGSTTTAAMHQTSMVVTLEYKVCHSTSFVAPSLPPRTG